MESMILKEVEEYCFLWKVGNIWKLVREVLERIYDELGFGKYDFFIFVFSYLKE